MGHNRVQCVSSTGQVVVVYKACFFVQIADCDLFPNIIQRESVQTQENERSASFKNLNLHN